MKRAADTIGAALAALFLTAQASAGQVGGGPISGGGGGLPGANEVIESMLKAVDAAGDEECLTFESTVGDFEWQACGAAIADADYGDIVVSSSGAVWTVDSNSIALTTDTTGNYVSSATTNQGLLLTGTEGASLGLIDCAATEVLKRNAGDTAWECAADATGSGISGSTGATDDALLCADGTGGSTLGVCTVGNLDNLRLDGNTASTTNTNGDFVIDPNGTGGLRLDSTSGVHSLLFGDNSVATGMGLVFDPANDAGRLRVIVTGSERFSFAANGLILGSTAAVTGGPDFIANNLDIRLERDAANAWEIVGGRASDTGAALKRTADANGTYEQFGCAGTGCTEALTLSTGGTTTATSGNIVPANSDIRAITVRVTTTITTAVNFTVAPTGKGAFCQKGTTTSTLTTLTAGTTYVLGPCPATYGTDLQNDTAKGITITTNANPGAGALRITVHPTLWTPPQS